MNLLTQLIPGIRDSRTPLAVGIIWAASAWVLSALLLGPYDELLSAVIREWQNLPTPLGTGALVVALYVMGIVLQILGRVANIAVVLVFGVVMLWLTGVTIHRLANFVIATSRTHPIYLAAAVAVLILAVAARHRYPYSRLESRLRSWPRWSVRSIVFWVRRLSRNFLGIVPARKVLSQLEADALADYFVEQPTVLEDLVEESNPRQLARMASVLSLDLDVLDFRPGRRAESIASRVLDHAEDKVAIAKCKESVQTRIAKDQVARVTLIETCLDASHLNSDLTRRLTRGDNRLHQDSPPAYSEYDRLRSEGEFRSSLAVPLGAFLGSVVYRLDLQANLNTTTLQICWVSILIVVVTLLLAGAAKTSGAIDFLYTCVQTGLTEPAPKVTGKGQVTLRSAPDWRIGARYRSLFGRGRSADSSAEALLGRGPQTVDEDTAVNTPAEGVVTVMNGTP